MTSQKRSRSICFEDEPVGIIEEQVDLAIQGVQESLLHKSSTLLQSTIRNTRKCGKKAKMLIRETYKSPAATKPKAMLKAFDVSKKFIEQDDVFLQDSNLSVGTRIKRACLELYDKYKELNEIEKCIVGLGANSIVDLTKRNSIHSTLFGEDQLKSLRIRYESVYESLELSDGDDESIKKVEKLARNDINAARALSNKFECTRKGLSSTLFDMYAEYLKILQFKKKVFRKDLDITEGDLAVKVWGPLLECIMRDEEDLRLKWGDSIGDSSGVTESHGFKVDVRAVHDNFAVRKNKRESDTGNVEIGRMDASVGKVFSDKTKLLIESKCVVDRLLFENIPNKNAVVPALQLTGLKATLFSLRLVSDGLYVALEEDRCSLPTNINNINSLRQVYSLLQKFRIATIDIANSSLRGNEEEEKQANLIKAYRRNTWIPPKKDKKVPPLPDYFISQ